jgi:hypothetical protein
MPWEETGSDHFVARHGTADRRGAVEVLELLEDTRARLGERVRALPAGPIAIVLHDSTAQLHAAQPLLPVLIRSTAPAARRYLVGRAGRDTIHVLAPRELRSRASNVEGSAELLRLAPAALYARLVVGEANPRLRGLRAVRWAWLGEGAAEWLSGRVRFARPAIARRLREGPPPAFPPAARDALLLGGTLVDLLAREEGPDAAMTLIHDAGGRGGARDALRQAFHGRALHHTEGTWRAHLGRLAGRE